MEEWLFDLIGYSMYVGIGFLSAIFIYFVLRKKVLGKFWAALLIGIIGAVLGSFLLDEFFRKLTDVYNVNILSALFFSCILIWVYALATPGGKEK
jgi:uncharacterized membrane protein YeaQ/YmgE (transglycosylase-associated protein family)